jgi:hypothetical protein
MTKAVIAGTFATGANPVSGNASDPLDIPTSTTTMRLTLTGLDASNTVKTQKSTNSGSSWVDQTTYNSDQNAVAVTVVPQEQWRVVGVTQQAVKDIRYKLSVES